MKKTLIQKPLIVKKSTIHGYGVFAGKDFSQNEIIEECYTLFCKSENTDFIDYFFENGTRVALPLGFGAIYNHSDDPNSYFYLIPEINLFVIQAKKVIKKGEEIFISYGNEWFSTRDMPVKNNRGNKYWRYFLGFPLRALIACSIVIAAKILCSFI